MMQEIVNVQSATLWGKGYFAADGTFQFRSSNLTLFNDYNAEEQDWTEIEVLVNYCVLF